MNALRGIAGRDFAYSEEDHLLTAGDMQYTYDVDGFLTNKTNITNPTNKTSYIYSSRGELLSVTLPNGRTIEYVHDPLGRRIAKKVGGVITEKYLWQGLTRLLAVYDGSNNLLMRFEYADDLMPMVVATEGVTYYLVYDQVGSLRVVADSIGNMVKRIDYDSFGNIIAETNSDLKIPFGFAGGLHDRDTGLVRFGYRDYDPDVGRWTAKDPILFAGGDTDLYGYVLNDPVNMIDPEGLIKWGAVIKGGGAVIFGGFMVYGGAILGVPAAIGGSASLGWGVTELVSGLMGSETNVATPNAAALTTLVMTGDMECAKDAALVQDVVFAAVVPTTRIYTSIRGGGLYPPSQLDIATLVSGNAYAASQTLFP